MFEDASWLSPGLPVRGLLLVRCLRTWRLKCDLADER